jgi:hypothetical protein
MVVGRVAAMVAMTARQADLAAVAIGVVAKVERL